MATDAARDFALLAATARRSIDDLRRAVHAAPPPRGRRGEHFLTVVEAALGALEAGVADREAEFASAADEQEQRAVIRSMRRINYDVMGLHEVSPWIESARGSKLALGLVYFVDELVFALLKAPADVVMTPSGTYMYSTIHKPFEDPLTNLGVAYPAAVLPIIVSYPVHEPDSLFLHLIIAHELGHSAIAEHNLDQEVYRRDPNPTGTRDTLSQAVAEYLTQEGGTPAAARGRLRVILRHWLAELICDALAVGFLGPSYLLTAAAFGAPFDGPEPSETHPPLTLRTHLLIERLTSWGWIPLLQAGMPETFAWMLETSTRPQQAAHRTYFLRLEEAIRNLSKTIEDVVSAHLGADLFQLDAHASNADELSALLERDILPAQLLDRSPASRRSIILSGWMHAFAKHGDQPVALASIVGDRDQQRFLTKALEMSVVLERWATL